MRGNRGAELLQLVDQLVVAGDDLIGTELEGVGLQTIPTALEGLPGLGDLQLRSDAGIARIDFGDELAGVGLGRQDVVLVGRVSGDDDKQPTAVVSHGCQHRPDALCVASAFDFIPCEGHLRVGAAEIEDAQQNGGDGHRDHQHTQFLPELQPT
ncbi:MAG TPA: hypothetical protein VGM84_20560 [Steroidobacteraceae bacterium]